MKGRKRHVLTDTLGLVLKAVVSSAGVQDRDGARLVLHALRAFGPQLERLRKVWVDGAYAAFVESARQEADWDVEVVERPAGQKGFVVVPKRWIGERTFGWLNAFRRLSKDFEYEVESSEAMLYAAMSCLMLRRLAPAPRPPSG